MRSVALYARRLLRRTWCARVRLHRAAVGLRFADACVLRARVFYLRSGRQHEHAAKACEVTGAQWPPGLHTTGASPRAAGTAALLHAFRARVCCRECRRPFPPRLLVSCARMPFVSGTFVSGTVRFPLRFRGVFGAQVSDFFGNIFDRISYRSSITRNS